MKLSHLIQGLNILAPYYDEQDGYHLGAEHDIIYAYATDKPVSSVDVAKMINLGWFQPQVDYEKEDEMSSSDYDPDAGWAAYT
jgi:hypothetical protein